MRNTIQAILFAILSTGVLGYGQNNLEVSERYFVVSIFRIGDQPADLGIYDIETGDRLSVIEGRRNQVFENVTLVEDESPKYAVAIVNGKRLRMSLKKEDQMPFEIGIDPIGKRVMVDEYPITYFGDLETDGKDIFHFKGKAIWKTKQQILTYCDGVSLERNKELGGWRVKLLGPFTAEAIKVENEESG